MRRTPLYLPLLAAALLLAASALPAAAGPGFDVGARGIYWFPSVSGDVKTEGFEKIDLETDLGVENDDLVGAEAFARVLWFGARAGFMPVKFDGDKTMSRSFTFGGTSYAVSERVVTEVDLKTADLEASFAPKITVPWLANLYAGVLLKGKMVDGTVTLDGGVAGKEKQDLSGIVPMVGVLAGAGVLNDIVRVDGRVAAIAYGGNHLYEGDVYLSVSPFDPPVVDLKLQGGYRMIDLKLEDGDLQAELKIAGPYAGLQIDF